MRIGVGLPGPFYASTHVKAGGCLTGLAFGVLFLAWMGLLGSGHPYIGLAVFLTPIVAAIVIYACLHARKAPNARAVQIDRMTGTQFEHLTADLMAVSGYRHVRVVGRAGDGGADILAAAYDGRPLAVQCKRYKGTIGVQHVRELIGACHTTYRGRWPMLVTSGTLTPAARQLAREGQVYVIERPGLLRWLDDSARSLA